LVKECKYSFIPIKLLAQFLIKVIIKKKTRDLRLYKIRLSVLADFAELFLCQFMFGLSAIHSFQTIIFMTERDNKVLPLPLLLCLLKEKWNPHTFFLQEAKG
jgi:hypothetical protein